MHKVLGFFGLLFIIYFDVLVKVAQGLFEIFARTFVPVVDLRLCELFFKPNVKISLVTTGTLQLVTMGTLPHIP